MPRSLNSVLVSIPWLSQKILKSGTAFQQKYVLVSK